MPETYYIQAGVVESMVERGEIFTADIDTLRRCLAGVSNTAHTNDEGRARQHEIAETIRHLIFLRQTEQAHLDSQKATRVALIVAAVAALAGIVQSVLLVAEYLGWCR